MIDDDELVRQKQMQIGLVRPARVAQLNRFKLEHQVVAQRSVPSQVPVVRASHLRLEGAQDAEDRRLLGAFLLQKVFGHRHHRAFELALGELQRGQVLVPSKPSAHDLQQHLAAGVERPEGEVALTRHQLQRRIDKANVPTAVSPRIFVAAGKDRAAVRIEPLQQGLERLR